MAKNIGKLLSSILSDKELISALMGKSRSTSSSSSGDFLKSLMSDGKATESLVGKKQPSSSDQQSSGGSGGTADAIQMAADIAGVADPTPIIDASNAAFSLYRAYKEPERRKEHLFNAVISGISAVPYVGDLAKLAKYGGKVGKVAKGTKAVKAAEVAKAAKVAETSKAVEAAKGLKSTRVATTETLIKGTERGEVIGKSPSVDLSSPIVDNPAGFTKADSKSVSNVLQPDATPNVVHTNASGGTVNSGDADVRKVATDLLGDKSPVVGSGGSGGTGGSGPGYVPGPSGGDDDDSDNSSDFIRDLLQGATAGAGAGTVAGLLGGGGRMGHGRQLRSMFMTPETQAVGEEAMSFASDVATKPITGALKGTLIGGPLGGLIGGFKGLLDAVIEIPPALLDWGESLKVSQEHLRMFSPEIAGAMGRSEMRQMQRDMASGRRTGDSTGGMIDALDDLKDELQPYRDVFTNASNTIVEAGLRIVKGMLKLGENLVYAADTITDAIPPIKAAKDVVEFLGEKAGELLRMGKGDEDKLDVYYFKWLRDAVANRAADKAKEDADKPITRKPRRI